METQSQEELLKSLVSERSSRISSEEECKKLKDLLNITESELKQKCQEIYETKKEYETKLCNIYMKIGKYKTTEMAYQKEIVYLKDQMHTSKTDLITATETGILKATQIDELYSVISQHREEISSLRNDICRYQSEVVSLERDNCNLLKLLQKKKDTKICQTDISLQDLCSQPIDSFSPMNSSINNREFSSTNRFNKTLPAEHSITKARSQMLLLKRSKERLNMQINLLSTLSSLN